jgi:hypothetical protein
MNYYQPKMTLDSSGNLGIGTSNSGFAIGPYGEWQKILKLAETNPAVKSALDKLMTTYHLSKDHE